MKIPRTVLMLQIPRAREVRGGAQQCVFVCVRACPQGEQSNAIITAGMLISETAAISRTCGRLFAAELNPCLSVCLSVFSPP
jgi:hypothetical protein